MISQITQNSGLFKTMFLVIGLVLIVFCFFLDVAQNKEKKDSYYVSLTFSGRVHTHMDKTDCFADIADSNCKDKFCDSAKATPWLGSFALGMGVLVIILQLSEDCLSGFLKKKVNWMAQLVCLGLSWILILIIPIIYIAKSSEFVSVKWLPIILEFFSLFCIAIAGVLYYQGNSSKGVGLLS